MPVEVAGAEPPAGDYGEAGDWSRGVACLGYAARSGDIDASCAEVARFLDSWERVNDGPPWVADGSQRMSSWPTYCGGAREYFGAVGGVGERKLTARAEAEGWYTPVDYRDL